MKKVLFVATITGHINAFHLPYLKMFKENKWETSVATGDNDNVINYCDKKYTISVSRSPYKIGNIFAIRELRKIINQEKIDIIHCHTPMGSVVTRLAARKARKKYHTRVIYTAHGFHFYKGAPLLNWLLFYPIEWFLAKYTDTLITINKEDYNLAKKRFSKRCHNIEYVPGVGIDEDKFNFKMTEKEKIEKIKSIGLKKEDYVLSCVARLDKNKNQGFLIDCMKDLVKENKNIHLLLVGPDELNGYYQKIVKDYNLEDNIHFLGRRDDVPQLLKITNIVVSASKREGLPVNVIEAFTSGVPVVALNCRGMEDLIENGKNGYIVNQNDKNIFIDKLLRLYNDKRLIKKILENNIEKSIFFDITNIEPEIKKIYNFYGG